MTCGRSWLVGRQYIGDAILGRPFLESLGLTIEGLLAAAVAKITEGSTGAEVLPGAIHIPD